MTTTPTQIKLFKYLADPARTRREQMHDDFNKLNLFDSTTNEATVVERLTNYLTENKRGYCKEGINRACVALGINLVTFKVGDQITTDRLKGLPKNSGVTRGGKTALTTGTEAVIIHQTSGVTVSDFYASDLWEIVYLPNTK